MQCFKKITLGISVFFLLFSLLSFNFVHNYISESGDYHELNKFSGTIDTFAIGSSYTLRSFNCKIIDEYLGCNSYNLGTRALKICGSNTLFQQEAVRNPIKTVFVEISLNTFLGNTYCIEGDEAILPRLCTFRQRIDYYFNDFELDYKSKLFARLCYNGVQLSIYDILGINFGTSNSSKGFKALEAKDVSMDFASIMEYNTIEVSTDTNSILYESFTRLLNQLTSDDIRTIIVVYPYSDEFLWTTSEEQLNSFHTECIEISQKFNCEMIDFNLCKEFIGGLNQSEMFYDLDHLSEQGATYFTTFLATHINQPEFNHENRNIFYQNYSERNMNSKYWKSFVSTGGETSE